MARELNVEIASLCLDCLSQYPYKSDPRAQQYVADAIKAASTLGSRVVLVGFFFMGDLMRDKEGTDVVIQRFREIAPTAEKAGVTLGIESWLNAEQHMAILDRVGSNAVKVYYDVGNSAKMGYDIYKEIRFLGKNICEFHAKDFDGLYGKGGVNFPEVRRAMDDIGYGGWIHMEGPKTPLGIEASLAYDARFLRTIFPRST